MTAHAGSGGEGAQTYPSERRRRPRHRGCPLGPSDAPTVAGVPSLRPSRASGGAEGGGGNRNLARRPSAISLPCAAGTRAAARPCASAPSADVAGPTCSVSHLRRRPVSATVGAGAAALKAEGRRRLTPDGYSALTLRPIRAPTLGSGTTGRPSRARGSRAGRGGPAGTRDSSPLEGTPGPAAEDDGGGRPVGAEEEVGGAVGLGLQTGSLRLGV